MVIILHFNYTPVEGIHEDCSEPNNELGSSSQRLVAGDSTCQKYLQVFATHRYQYLWVTGGHGRWSDFCEVCRYLQVPITRQVLSKYLQVPVKQSQGLVKFFHILGNRLPINICYISF